MLVPQPLPKMILSCKHPRSVVEQRLIAGAGRQDLLHPPAGDSRCRDCGWRMAIATSSGTHGHPPSPATIRNVGNRDRQFIQMPRVGIVVGAIGQKVDAGGDPHRDIELHAFGQKGEVGGIVDVALLPIGGDLEAAAAQLAHAVLQLGDAGFALVAPDPEPRDQPVGIFGGEPGYVLVAGAPAGVADAGAGDAGPIEHGDDLAVAHRPLHVLLAELQGERRQPNGRLRLVEFVQASCRSGPPSPGPSAAHSPPCRSRGRTGSGGPCLQRPLWSGCRTRSR